VRMSNKVLSQCVVSFDMRYKPQDVLLEKVGNKDL